MNIGINGYEAVLPRFGYDAKTGLPNRAGSGEYCYQLLNALHHIDKKNNYFVYLPCTPSADMPGENNFWHYVVVPGKRLWTLLQLSKALLLDREKLDVFFSPTHYLPLYTKCPAIISLMDLSYLHFPKAFAKRDLYQLKLWTKMSVLKAKHILTISESSKDDIIRHYKVKDSEVTVTYPGIKKELSQVTQ